MADEEPRQRVFVGVRVEQYSFKEINMGFPISLFVW
jgi:hypothetical protein